MYLSELRDDTLASINHPDAWETQTARRQAATWLRLLLARVFGHTEACTSSQWQYFCCLTPANTIGIVNIAHGVAHDTEQAAIAPVAALGFADQIVAEGNNPAAAGHTPAMPDGWKAILLMTWHGYEGDGTQVVPPWAYERNRFTTKFVQFGLQTVYGKRGLPRQTLTGEEPLDPSWWPFSSLQKSRVRDVVKDWFLAAAPRLLRGQEWADSCRARDPEGTYNAVASGPWPNADSAAHDARLIADDAADRVCDSIGVVKLVQADQGLNLIGGQGGAFRSMLANTIEAKLVPVAEVLLPLAESRKGRGLLMLGSPYEKALAAVAFQIGAEAVYGLDAEIEKIVREDLVAILYGV